MDIDSSSSTLTTTRKEIVPMRRGRMAGCVVLAVVFTFTTSALWRPRTTGSPGLWPALRAMPARKPTRSPTSRARKRERVLRRQGPGDHGLRGSSATTAGTQACATSGGSPAAARTAPAATTAGSPTRTRPRSRSTRRRGTTTRSSDMPMLPMRGWPPSSSPRPSAPARVSASPRRAVTIRHRCGIRRRRTPRSPPPVPKRTPTRSWPAPGAARMPRRPRRGAGTRAGSGWTRPGRGWSDRPTRGRSG